MRSRHVGFIIACWSFVLPCAAQDGSPAAAKKLKDVVVYRDDTFYSTFPSIVRRPDGELLVAFRRAPDQRNFGEAKITHTDPNSQFSSAMRGRAEGCGEGLRGITASPRLPRPAASHRCR
jgi:hypothetical protein